MPKVYMTPLPSQAQGDTTNAINQIILRAQKMLPAYGWEITEDPNEADLFAGHAGISNPNYPIDIAHCHGLYPTYDQPAAWTFQANKAVIDSLRRAASITVPSQWVADLLRRDMHIEPDVIGWGVDAEEWVTDTSLKASPPYILWNKTRAGGVCDPRPMNALAARLPHAQFKSTFGEAAPNVKILGLTPYEDMKVLVKGAQIYLSTTLETFGIGTLEAMASGTPVLGYDWGGTHDLVQHQDTGFLVRPHDIEGLVKGYEYILTHWERLSQNCIEYAKTRSWDQVFASIAQVYTRTWEGKHTPTVTVVIPAHNYGKYVEHAIRSVHSQGTTFDFELIVVADNCTDDTVDVVDRVLNDHSNIHLHRSELIEVDYRNPADSRNRGIMTGTGDYILCLDADDLLLGQTALQRLYDALKADSTLGIAYSKLHMMRPDGTVSDKPGPWPNACDPAAQMRGQNQVPTCCMFRRDAWVKAGGYRRRYVPAEDAHLWASIMVRGYQARLIDPEVGLFAYRLHEESLSHRVRTGKMMEPKWAEALQNEAGKIPSFASVAPPSEHPSHRVRNYLFPLVSIIIPVGPNHLGYLPEALDSVEAQTEWRWECIVVNDTGGALRPFLKPYPWVRIVELNTGDRRFGNPGKARNAGVRASKGRYLVFLDADDFITPDYLDKAYNLFKSTGKYVYTDWVSITKTGNLELHSTPEYNPNTLFMNGAIHSVTAFVPRIDFEDVGGFAEDMRSWEDMDFFMRLAKIGYCGVRLPEPLLYYRYSTGNMRELALNHKDELNAYIKAHYGPELGRSQIGKMECCGQPKRVNTQKQAIEGGMVRIKYGGLGVPVSPAPLRGSATRTYYGERASGEVFMVWKADYDTMSSIMTLYHEQEAKDFGG